MTVFQSTHPSWGATKKKILATQTVCDFNPRTHRGVRRLIEDTATGADNISIHAPIVGCDLHGFLQAQIHVDFNPRTHRGVRLERDSYTGEPTLISIHAPIVGCDFLLLSSCLLLVQISIHAPIVGCDPLF